MTTALVRAAAPAADPVTLAEAKAHCRVDFTDHDGEIGGFISAAVAHIDALGTLGRAMVTQDWAQWEPQSPGWVRLDLGPFQSLQSVEYYDAAGVLQSATLSDFETRLQGDYVVCKPKDNAAWPNADARADAIKITYRVGYGDAADVPVNIKQAILMLVAHWYENREASSEGKLMAVPMGVDYLLSTERVSWYG